MHKLFPCLALGVAWAPFNAVAQSQGPGTQELLSELQRQQVTSSSRDVQVEPVSEQPAATPDVEEFQIGSITVSDPAGNVLPEFGKVIEPYIGNVVGQSQLQAVASAVALDARIRGYSFASAYIPEQQIALGSLKVTVDLGRIDSVDIEGSKNRRLVQMLNRLEGRFAMQAEIERALLLARDIPGVVIKDTEYVRESGRGKLIVRTTQHKSSGFVGIDNYGDKAAGPVRARLDVEYSGIIDSDDRISVGVTATPIDPEELTFVSARYSKILNDDGSQILLTGGAGRTHENQPGSDWRSRSRYVALGFNTPVLRSNDGSLWLTAEAAFVDVDQFSPVSAALEDHVTTLSLSASGNVKLVGGRLSGGVTYVRGIDILSATGPQDARSSRFDGSGVFSKEQIWLNWLGPLGSGFSMRVAGNGQVASRPLLASHEIGLGGAGFGRAYSFYERSGDEGAMGLMELRFATDNPTKHIDWLQIYGFVDGGYVGNLDNGFGSGGLVSGGAGLRSGFGKAEIGLEIAVPVDDVRFETVDRSPRLNVSVGYRF